MKIVFLDVDGTLLDFDGYVKEALQTGFHKFHLGTYEPGVYQVFEQINTDLWEQIERGELTREELMKIRFRKIFDALGIDFDGAVFEQYFIDNLYDSAILIPGAMELVTYLAGKYPLCIASNGPIDQQENRLRKAGLLPFMDKLFLSEQIGAAKPSPQFFDAAFRQLPGVSPEETILIGDSLTADMAGASQYGIKTCWYNPFHKEAPSGLSLDYTVDSLGQIQNIL
jgi:2-haloacid dehalogenase